MSECSEGVMWSVVRAHLRDGESMVAAVVRLARERDLAVARTVDLAAQSGSLAVRVAEAEAARDEAQGAARLILREAIDGGAIEDHPWALAWVQQHPWLDEEG